MTDDQKSSKETQNKGKAQRLNLQQRYQELIQLRRQVQSVEARTTKSRSKNTH